MAGAPVGNQNAAKGKKWQAALNRALETRRRVEGREMLDVLANVLIDQALAGEQWAFAQIGDRLDGKPVQAIESKSHIVTETVSEEQARVMAEEFISSASRTADVGPQEPDRIHEGDAAGLPARQSSPEDSSRA
jgi:hypothetical protein